MSSNSNELLARLGAGESIGMVCESAGMSRAEFDKWWDEETRRRVPDPGGAIEAGVSGDARITRNRWGVPHISASNDTDLFFTFGYAWPRTGCFNSTTCVEKATEGYRKCWARTACNLT